jgi:threonine/homoserine/homoserine lactone efflux protein
MPELSTLAVIATASLALAVVPGPSVLYIVTRSITQGKVAGIVSVLGIHVGTLFHVAAAALGLSALLVRSVVAFNFVKYAGAAYLVFLGIRRLRGRDQFDSVSGATVQPLGRVFMQAIVVNVLNPKTALFFFAFLPQFVQLGSGSVRFQMFIFGVVFIVVAFISDSAYSLVSSALGRRLRGSAVFARRQRLFSGGIFVALGLSAAVSGSRSSA